MNNAENKNILLATGVYPPEIGGPATYVKILQDELPKYGFNVKIVTYGSGNADGVAYINREQNQLARYWQFFLALWKIRKDVDVIYAFDLLSVGLPCAIFKLIFPGKKFVIRLGGDRQWEEAIQQRTYQNTLRQYYIDKKFSRKEKLFYTLSNFVLSSADHLIFNAEILRDIYTKHRGIEIEKTSIVKNFIPKIDKSILQPENRDYLNILFIGRIILVRNLQRLIDAFVLVKEKMTDKIVLNIIGNGPEKNSLVEYVKGKNLGEYIFFSDGVDHDTALNKIFNSDLLVFPSLTEINSNTIIEAIRLNKPVVTTRESGPYYADMHCDNMYYINPLDIDDIANSMIIAMQNIKHEQTEQLVCDVARISNSFDWVINEHIEIFKNITK